MGMKKLLAVLFSALLLVGVAGCGGNNAQQGAVTQKVMNAKTKQDFEPVTEVKEGRKNVYAVLKVMKGNYWEEVIRGIKAVSYTHLKRIIACSPAAAVITSACCSVRDSTLKLRASSSLRISTISTFGRAAPLGRDVRCR